MNIKGVNMKHRTKQIVSGTATMAMAAFLCTQSSQAAVIAYEGFDSAAAVGTDVTVVGTTGSGFSGYVNTNFRMDMESGLNYLDLVTVGGSGGMEVGVSGTQNLQMALTSSIANSGTIYVSYLMSVAGVNSFGLNVGMQDGTVGDAASVTPVTEAVFRSTSSNWGIYGDGTGIDARTGPDSSPDATLTFFVVSELNMDSEVMTTWLNPTDLKDVSGTAAFTLTDTATSWDSLSHFGFSLGSDILGTIDEIRIGDTLLDVTPTVPEPSSLALLLGGGMLARLIRKRTVLQS